MYKINKHKILADSITPIGVYQSVRQHFTTSILFESSEYRSIENSHSIIAFDELESIFIDAESSYAQQIESFIERISFSNNETNSSFNGIFGHTSYNAVISMDNTGLSNIKSVPELPFGKYSFFRFVLVFNHFNNQLEIIENCPLKEASKLNQVKHLLNEKIVESNFFETIGDETSSCTDAEFIEKVKLVKEEIKFGNSFQCVISRRFSKKFMGDDFNLYRSLRTENPSPYLFFADFGSYKIMGSSPEAQIIVKNSNVEIHPIAGTYKKTGNPEIDDVQKLALLEDAKENAEHNMLVDLARNDLSRNCTSVKIKKHRELQEFSHVFHLVSNVTGKLIEKQSAAKSFADAFPAGTLSGAPKIKSMQLIEHFEPHARSFYGGSIGYYNFQNETNHAIVIRSFCSKNNELHYQAGAGVVINSNPESELQEVNNKLAALRKALKKAENIQTTQNQLIP